MTASGKADAGEGRAPRCPICGKPSVAEFAPFSSKRCAEIDLHRWLSGSYAIPAVEGDDDSPEAAGEGPRDDQQ